MHSAVNAGASSDITDRCAAAANAVGAAGGRAGRPRAGGGVGGNDGAPLRARPGVGRRGLLDRRLGGRDRPGGRTDSRPRPGHRAAVAPGAGRRRLRRRRAPRPPGAVPPQSRGCRVPDHRLDPGRVRRCPTLSGAGLSARRRQPAPPRRGRVVAQPGALRPRRRHRPVPRVVGRDHVVAGEPDREPRRRRQRPQAHLQRRREPGPPAGGVRRGDGRVLPRVQGPHAVGRVRVVQRPPGRARQPVDRRRRPDARRQPAEQAVLRRQRRPGPAVPDLVGGALPAALRERGRLRGVPAAAGGGPQHAVVGRGEPAGRRVHRGPDPPAPARPARLGDGVGRAVQPRALARHHRVGRR